MEIPWNYSSENELTSKINSFFDHRYPLLGYKYASEHTSANTTTMNFLGIEAGPPTQYYSSHNGIDFGLPYGTLVKAPAQGYATYYYCRECGHSIKIDHLNGYETTFMHLQFDGLVAQDSVPKLVNSGDPIGKVGMTGNTSGPHLHINITKDLNNNGFIDDFPMGLIDPFGWQNDKFEDPWKSYIWQDILGEHTGSESLYLWKIGIPTSKYRLENSVANVITNNNKSVLFPSGAVLVNAVVELYDYARPKIDETFLAGPILKYIEDSSILIRIIDLIGNPVKETKKPVELTFDFSAMELNNVIVPSLKIYHFNIDTQEWEPLDTLLFDLENKKITGATSRFSQFALFGEIIDNDIPYSTIAVTGEKTQNGWYTEYPTISFTSNGTVYYKIGDDIDCKKYENPFVLERIGIFAIEYKAVSENEVWETAKESELIRVSNGRYVGDVKVKNSVFQIPEL